MEPVLFHPGRPLLGDVTTDRKMRAMNRRPAVTLVEVLIAIFVMALGLMSILALFPVAAVQMSQALKDQRSAECAANAAAWIRMAWKDACELGGQGQPDPRQRFVVALN